MTCCDCRAEWANTTIKNAEVSGNLFDFLASVVFYFNFEIIKKIASILRFVLYKANTQYQQMIVFQDRNQQRCP